MAQLNYGLRFVDGIKDRTIKSKQDTTFELQYSYTYIGDGSYSKVRINAPIMRIGDMSVPGTIETTESGSNYGKGTFLFEAGEGVLYEITDPDLECTIETPFERFENGAWEEFATPSYKFTLKIAKTYETTDENGDPVVIDMNPVLNDGFFGYVSQDDILPDAPENVLVGGYSKAVFSFSIDKIETRFGAKVEQINIRCESKDYIVRDFTQPVITDVIKGGRTVEYVYVQFSVMDSRMNTTKLSYKMPVYIYSAPVLIDTSVYRSNGDRTENDQGAFLTAKASAAYKEIGGHNKCTITAEWGERGGDMKPATISGETVIGNGTILPIKSYVVTFTATDTIGKSNTVSLIVPTPGAVFDALKGGNGFAFGKMAERAGFLDSAWEISSDGGVYAGAEPQEDGSYTYKAYMDKEGNIHADEVVEARTIAGSNAVIKYTVFAEGGEFSAAVYSPMAEFSSHVIAGAGEFDHIDLKKSINVGGNATFDGGAVFNGPVIFNGGTTGGGDSGGSSAPSFIVDETLTYENGVLSVNTADTPEQDNTLPITSAAVFESVGNINALLETI